MIDSSTRVLLVDDFSLIRTMLRDALGDLGIKIIDEAENGEDALTKLREAAGAGRPYGAVFLDWNMPGMSGIELLKLCRAEDPFKSIPIIMVTSESEKQQVLEAMVHGATDYLVKPFSPEALGQKIERINNSPRAAAQ